MAKLRRELTKRFKLLRVFCVFVCVDLFVRMCVCGACVFVFVFVLSISVFVYVYIQGNQVTYHSVPEMALC